MDLRDYVRVLRQGWQVILGLTILGVAAGLALVLSTTKVYEASTTVFVASSPSLSSNSQDLNQGGTFIQDRVQSYTSIANSPSVTSRVIQNLGLKLSNSALSNKISADAPLNKVLINLHVTDTDPAQAARLANAVSSAFITAVQTTETTDANGKPVVKLTVIHPATKPTAAIKPSKTLDLGLGLVVGLILGIGIVILRDVLDNTVKTPQDFEQFDLPILGLVPYDKRAQSNVVAFRDDLHGARAEAYRQLRTNLQFVNVDAAPKVIAVTSAVPGEGKTTTALNLASALAEGGFRVCLIEADLRRPTVAKVLGLVSDVGFTTALIGKADPIEILQTVSRNLAVLTCGPVPPNPSELLLTEQARTVIRTIADICDYVIIDTAPVLPIADGSEVSAMADATIVVHHSGKSTKDQVSRTLENLGNVGTRPVGAVLNMMSRKRTSASYYYGYAYNYTPQRDSGRRRKGSEGDQRLSDSDTSG